MVDYVNGVEFLTVVDSITKTVGLFVFELVSEDLKFGCGFKHGTIHDRDASSDMVFSCSCDTCFI